VQSAIDELETEKLAKSGGEVTGELLIGSTGSLVFEGSTTDAFETKLVAQDPSVSDKILTLPNITGTLITTGDTDTVTSTMVDGSLTNTNLAANSAIAFTKLASLTAASILVGNASNEVTAVPVTGDISIDNAGLTAIGAGKIVNSMVSGTAAIDGSKVTAASLSASGTVQLNDSTNSTSTSEAATANALKTAYDLATTANTAAAAAFQTTGGSITGDVTLANAKELRFSEASGDGSNYTAFKAQAQSSDITLTLPSTSPSAGQVLKASVSTPTTLEWSTDTTNTNAADLQGTTLASNIVTSSLTSVGTLSSLTVSGGITGNLTGTATTATNLVVVDESSSTNCFPLFAAASATGNKAAFTGTNLTFNSSSGALTATSFVGSGSNLTALNASNLSSGIVDVARLGSGSSVTTKFLRGDNTWQTISATPEGTAILSTGESGGTKFLREDGDGTCSWQTVTGFVTLSQGGTVNGQINLTMPGAFPLKIDNNNDAKITLQGTNNPYIQFREGSTNKAEVAWSADGYLKLNNAEDGSQLRIQDDLKFSVDGSTFYSVLTSNSTASSLTSVGTLTGLSINGDVSLTGADGNILWDKSETSLKIDDDVTTYWGDGADLQIEHFASGSLSRIYSSATGGLDIKIVSGVLRFKSESGGSDQTGGTYTPAAGWTFNHAGAARIATASTGVNITGTLDVDGHVNLSDSDYLQLGDSQDLQLGNNGTNNFIQASGSLLQILTSTDHPIQLKHNSTTRLTTSSTGVEVTGGLTISGDLSVSGTTTTIDSVTLSVKDKNIELGVVSSPSDATADGGGITLKGASDKTFNWVNSTDAWTSSEHIQVASGKTFSGDGSGLTGLNASNLGYGTVATARLGSGTASSSNFLRGDGSWQTIDLTNLSANSLTSGTLPDARFPSALPAISGANLTNLPAGGNSVDLVASGAIAAGKPVIIKSDGKAQQVQTMQIAYGPQSIGTNSQISSHTNMTSVQVAQNLQYPDWQVSVCGFRGASGASNIYIQYGVFNNATGSNAAVTPLQITYLHDGLGNNIDVAAHKFMSGRNFFITAVNSGATQIGSVGYSQLWSVSMNSSGTLTKHQKINVSGRILDIQPIGVVSGDYTLMVFRTDSSGVHVQAFTVNSSGYFTAGTTHSPSSTNGYAQAENGKMAWNKDFTRVGIAWVRASDEKAFVSCAAWSGTAFSWAAGSQLNWPNAVQGNDYGGGVAIACDGFSGKYVCTYQDSNVSKAVCVDPGTSGQNANPGTAITIHSSNPDGNFAICDNVAVENVVNWAGRYNNGPVGNANIVISGTNTLTVSSVTNVTYQDHNVYCNIGLAPEYTTLSNQTYYSAYIIYRYNSNWKRVRSRITTPGTNITTNSYNNVLNYCNILGFAEDAISDGATGTIKLPGNVVGNQSGLSAGTFYYMQSSGALGTSEDNSIYNIKAGIAISSTQLVIGDPNRI